ncbi:hypothetical protein SMD20_33135 [Nonomuraea sp. LP-02]|uniref:hypothetical protein n=1 Tax=Nonomuraea sp. LP-02 TaxID=3097960 RepID=UPI002E32F42A|nr:hypothetical protein [Nonomuraea sp. LP-02]MED7929135.1 hypothetical protein [Nonomuraea sp. LP-02]
MDLRDTDLGEFMQEVGAAGFSMMVKIDDERLRKGGRPWTVLLSGPRLKGSGVVRWDCRDLEECLKVVIDALRALPGTWEWLELYSE